MQNNLCIVIKAPNQKYDDIKVNCELNWTILDLKKYLSAEYPSKPKPSDQRLIYSGHLLKDNQHLNEIIEPSENAHMHTFHLVVPQRPNGAIKTNVSNQSGNDASNSENNDLNEPNTSSSTSSLNPMMNSAPSSFTLPQVFTNTGDLFFANNNLQDYNLMMQEYMQYMGFAEAYIQSMQTMQAAMFNGQVSTDSNIVYPNNITNININTNDNNNNNNNNNNRINENQPNNIDFNNNGEPEEGNRNWTDFLTSLSKALVLGSIIYLYTSLGRLLLLAMIVIFVYLYRFMMQHNNINNNNQPQQQHPMNQQQANEVNNNNGQNDDRPSVDDGTPANTNVFVPDNTRLNGLRLFWIFVSSFFTSLIPDPVPIN